MAEWRVVRGEVYQKDTAVAFARGHPPGIQLGMPVIHEEMVGMRPGSSTAASAVDTCYRTLADRN